MTALRSELSSRRTMDRAPVDVEHLRRFTLGDRDLELEILGLFAGQLPITIGAMRSAATQQDWGIAAHTLKGSAMAVGAWSIADLAETAEHMPDLPPDSERAAVTRRLEEAAREVRAYIAALGTAD